MGYLIKAETVSEIETFVTDIRAIDMQNLFSTSYPLTPTQKAGFIFVPTICFIQVNGTTPYSSFSHMWIFQGGGNNFNSTFAKTLSNILSPGSVSSFIVNLEHGVLPTNVFGNRVVATRDFELAMDTDDLTGDGDGKVTMKGFYVPIFT
jgi:hypothetical protein